MEHDHWAEQIDDDLLQQDSQPDEGCEAGEMEPTEETEVQQHEKGI